MEDTLRIPSGEAAKRLDRTPRTIRRWYGAGTLAGGLIGGRLWIDWPPQPGTPRTADGRDQS